MPGGKVQIPPVYKRLLSLRWFRPTVQNESTETTRQWKKLKHGDISQQKQREFKDGGITKEQANSLIFRAGRETQERLFHGTHDEAYFPDIEPRVEHFKEDDIHQIRGMLSRSYRSYKVDRASVWRMLYYAELLMKGYTLHRLVSRGDFGVVYSATLNGVNCKASVEEEITKDGATTISIKIIDKSDTPWYQARNEIAAHASTSGHPNVLKLYQVFHTATATYLVQEFADRGSLESVVPRSGLKEEECRNLMKGVLHGLRHLQRLDVVHRNLTCANILLTSQGTVKIAEFGLACVLPDRDFPLHKKVGTAGYMAPEILRGLRYNGFFADIWTIGIVLYFLLHKFLPFTDEDLLLYNCWHCLDFTHRSLSVELCLLLRSILQYRPTQRPSVGRILRHDWFALDTKPRVKSQVKDNVPTRPPVHPERLNDRFSGQQRSSSVQSVQAEPQKRDLGPCWANLMCSDGQVNERITLRSRLVSHSQQELINRLERKSKARSKNKTQRIPPKESSSLKKVILPELSSVHQIKKPLHVTGKEETAEPINLPPGQVSPVQMPPTSSVHETPTDVISQEPDAGHEPEKGVFCTARKCIRQIQQERMLFETPSSSFKSLLTIQIASVSEDDEDVYEEDGNEEMKQVDEEPTMKIYKEDDMNKNRDIGDKTTEKNAPPQDKDSGKKIDEEATVSGTRSFGQRQSPTVEKTRTFDEDIVSSEKRLSEDRGGTQSEQPPRGSRESVASSHQMKENSSERRLIASIRALNDYTSSNGSLHSVQFPSRGSGVDAGNLEQLSKVAVYASQPSLEALAEVPAEYAPGLDVEGEEIERLIRIQYYNQHDLPSAADDPLEAEVNVALAPDLLMRGGKPGPRLVSHLGSLGLVGVTDLGDREDETPPPPIDIDPIMIQPELAIDWNAVNNIFTGPDSADVAGLRETRTKSRTTVVSKAPSLRAIMEERLAAGKGGHPDSLRKAESFGKRGSDGFSSKIKSKDHLLSTSASSVGRLMTQSQLQIQEERSESAVWESISSRGVARGSYPKLAASFACETSLHSIIELTVEKDAE